jgi:hypothetical protein
MQTKRLSGVTEGVTVVMLGDIQRFRRKKRIL